MKKLLALLALCLLAGCSSKETIEVNYVHSNHNAIVEKVLGEALDKKTAKEIFDSTESIDVYYEQVDENNVTFMIVNNMDYYYTGEVDFEVCPFKVSVSGLAPYGYATQTVECPNFEEGSQFTFTGQIHERKEEYKYTVEFESYYYQDNETLFDYVLDLEEITVDDLKELVNYIYTENVLLNHEGEMWVRVYPEKPYLEAYEKDTEAAWNELDTTSLAGKIYIDAVNDLAEIYDAKSDDLIERINFAK